MLNGLSCHDISFLPPPVFHLRLDKDKYYSSENTNVTACLMVDGGDPVDHVIYFIVETKANDTAGKFTVYRNEYMLWYNISPDQFLVWTMRRMGQFTGLKMVTIKSVSISQF